MSEKPLKDLIHEKNTRLVAIAQRADRLVEKLRVGSTPVLLADLEHLKNLVHEAVELGQKARFLWLSADERATNLGAQVNEVQRLRENRTQIIAERDTQIITWLLKKAGEYGQSNREERAASHAVWRMADKLSRGAVRDTDGGLTGLAQLKARVAELEAERHSTNEALSDAAEQLRVQRDRIAGQQADADGMRPGERRLAEQAFADLEATHWKRLDIDPPSRQSEEDPRG
jgi:hypothetical protein